MKYGTLRAVRVVSALLLLIFVPFLPTDALSSPAKAGTRPVVLTTRVENGGLIYRLDGKRVEDSVQNSLLTNLGYIVRTRGTEVPVFIIIDVHAPFSEVGKLETALDKSDLTHRRLFVSNFRHGIMNEIHWDERPIPLPTVY